jgi:hypothetical protein
MKAHVLDFRRFNITIAEVSRKLYIQLCRSSRFMDFVKSLRFLTSRFSLHRFVRDSLCLLDFTLRLVL